MVITDRYVMLNVLLVGVLSHLPMSESVLQLPGRTILLGQIIRHSSEAGREG